MTIDIVSNIQKQYATMTKMQQKIADFMLADPQSMTFNSKRIKRRSQSIWDNDLEYLYSIGL